MASLSTRIKHLIELKNLNVSRFEKAIGVANNTIGTFLRRDSSLSSDILIKVLHAFPDVNPDWLLIGQGDVLRSVEGNTTPEEYTSLIDELLQMNLPSEVGQKLVTLRKAIAQLDMSHAMQQIQITKLEKRTEELERLLKNSLLVPPRE